MDLKRAEMIARDTIAQYVPDWKFQFDRAVSRLGYTNQTTKTISLSRHATTVNDEAQVINTILHEVAHALVGPHQGHNDIWRMKAQGIGCNGERCSRIAIHAPAKYAVKCNNCPAKWNYYRKPSRIELRWHSTCGKEKGRLTLIELGGN